MGLTNWIMKRQLKKAEKLLPDLMDTAGSMLNGLDKIVGEHGPELTKFKKGDTVNGDPNATD